LRGQDNETTRSFIIGALLEELIIRGIKSRRMRWMRHVALMGARDIATKF
jgi:hypothetical protein